MGKGKAMSRVDQLLESLREGAMRIDDLIDLFVATDFGIGAADKTASIEKNLESICKKTNRAADNLERTLEIFDEDRYLDWLLKVPADSKLFESRRAQFRSHKPAKSN
ncbi:MAG: hypothetical protein ACLP5H_31975 [Desulfomonilaceae bacterium]